jgi:hypothetical protein
MNIRKNLLAGVLAASFASFALPSYAATVYLTTAPPAPRIEKYEVREGYVWVPGSWQWHNGKHEWVNGHHVAQRKGYSYHGDRWVQHNNKWTMQQGGWGHDSDHDGTPDRLDSQPNNPRRQ